MYSSQQISPSASHLPTLASCSPGLPPPLVFLSVLFSSLSLPMSKFVQQMPAGARCSPSFTAFSLSPYLAMLSPNLILTIAIFILLLSPTLSPVPSHCSGFEAFNSYYKNNACINYSLVLNIYYIFKSWIRFFSQLKNIHCKRLSKPLKYLG